LAVEENKNALKVFFDFPKRIKSSHVKGFEIEFICKCKRKLRMLLRKESPFFELIINFG
jgi:hypothetical protein